jgi:putative transcriptional regulator
MPLKYKVNLLNALKAAGYSTTRIRKEKLLAEGTLQKFRTGEGISWSNIQTICALLHCQPGDLMEYVPEDADLPE